MTFWIVQATVPDLWCNEATDAEASGSIDQPSGDPRWSWMPPGVECRYDFNEGRIDRVTTDASFLTLPLVVLAGAVALLLGVQRRRSAQADT
jgi:hypothetical protein